MRVLFWGTSEFAVPSLRSLVGEGFEVVGVVTQPDRPAGRSRSRALPPPVKATAQAEGLSPVLQPERPRGDEFMDQLKALDPDVSVVASYGHLLTDAVIARAPLGTINVHASLLPALRGAAPIRAAIRDGHEVTGVTIMRMVRELDAGPIIHQVSTPIAPDETYGELHLRLSELGALALIEALTLLELGKADERAQDESAITHAAKINRDSSRIDWGGNCMSVARHIRAFDPTPGALTTLEGRDVKLFGARAIDSGGDATANPGTVLAIGEEGMRIACGAGAVNVSHVQPASKRRMPVLAWRRGRGIALADRLGT